MKSFFTFLGTLIVVLLSFIDSSAQRYFSVVFTKLPADFQLYARDDNNNADVAVEGYIELPDWQSMSLVTYRNKERVAYSNSALAYGGKTTANFSLKSTIKAEMADYDFEVYAKKNETDSVLIVRKTEIVAGDFFLISGQSNGAASGFGPWSSKYCRTIARTPDQSPAITPADTLWTVAAWSWPYVGAWGMEMQKYILENDGIPTCVINGSLPGARISVFLVRDEANHKNPNTLYGQLLYRVGVSKASRIRAFFWVHGEQEVFENIPGYDQLYDQLHKYWEEDYPQVEKFITMQTNVLLIPDDNKDPKGGQIRDFLRRTKYIYAKTDHFSPIGVPGYDGIHYSRPGYEEYGHRVYQFIRPQFYGSTDTLNVKSPDIKKAFYTSAEKNEIKLVFDRGQQLQWAPDTTIKGQDGNPLLRSLKNFFYLDGDETKESFSAGTANENEVILKLKNPSTASLISYLPSFYSPNLPVALGVGVFNGPYLKNKRGFGAFSFNKVAIGGPILLSTFSGEPGGAMVFLKWSEAAGATQFILERKMEGGAFSVLKVLDKSILRYDDFDVREDAKYTYRLIAINDQSESLPKEVTVTYSPVLGIEPTASANWKVFPNPFSTELHIEFNSEQNGLLEVYSGSGQRIEKMNLQKSRLAVFSSVQWPAGLYIVSLVDENGKRFSQKVVKVK